MSSNRQRAYPQYQDSGVEWLGAVPAHWTTLALSRVTESRCDGPFGSGLKSEHYVADGVRVVRLQNIGWCEFVDKDRAYIEDNYARDLGDHSVVAGDLLIAGLGDEGHPVGRACVAPEGIEPAMVKADCFRFRLNTRRIFPRFAAYQLSATATVTAGLLSSGATRSRVNLSTTGSRKIAVPPLQEQVAIAKFLDQEMARIDALVAKKERLIGLLQEKRTALIARAVTKGIVPAAPMKDSGVEWLGEFPATWDVKPNSALFEERDERGRDDLPILEVSIASGVRIRQFSDSKVEQRSDDLGAYKVARAGDIAFNKMRMWQGAVGVAPEDGLVSPDCIVARPRTLTEPRYYAAVFRTRPYMAEVYRWSHGIVDDRNRLYWGDFKAIRSPFPPPEEQRQIVAFLDQQTSHVDALVAKVHAVIDTLEERRTTMVSAAVTGKIDVREATA